MYRIRYTTYNHDSKDAFSISTHSKALAVYYTYTVVGPAREVNTENEMVYTRIYMYIILVDTFTKRQRRRLQSTHTASRRMNSTRSPVARDSPTWRTSRSKPSSFCFIFFLFFFPARLLSIARRTNVEHDIDSFPAVRNRTVICVHLLCDFFF